MKRVMASACGASVEVLRQLLERSGVACLIRNESLSNMFDTAPFAVELWVEHDEDFATAEELYHSWCLPEPASIAGWTCTACGQTLAMQFDSCWQCGASRSGSAPDSEDCSLPGSWDEASHRAEEMSALLDDILHRPERQAEIPGNRSGENS